MDDWGVNLNRCLKVRAGRVRIPGLAAKPLALVSHLYQHLLYDAVEIIPSQFDEDPLSCLREGSCFILHEGLFRLTAICESWVFTSKQFVSRNRNQSALVSLVRSKRRLA